MLNAGAAAGAGAVPGAEAMAFCRVFPVLIIGRASDGAASGAGAGALAGAFAGAGAGAGTGAFAGAGAVAVSGAAAAEDDASPKNSAISASPKPLNDILCRTAISGSRFFSIVL